MDQLCMYIDLVLLHELNLTPSYIHCLMVTGQTHSTKTKQRIKYTTDIQPNNNYFHVNMTDKNTKCTS